MGTIGSERTLSFAVVGDTPNVANRLQRLTRPLDAAIAISQDVVDTAQLQSGVDIMVRRSSTAASRKLGRQRAVRVWTLAQAV
jgi:adenylate cyclase